VRKRVMSETSKRIDRTAIDALLYGLEKSLDYLGEQGQVILEKMGSAMVQYLVETGTISTSGKPREFDQSLRRLLTKNGYNPDWSAHSSSPRGTISSSNLVQILASAGWSLGARASPKRTSSRGTEQVDWVLYEALLYGMTKALDDQLGVQGQLILDRIGTSMLDYLLKVGAIKPSDDMQILLQRVIDYFVKAGYAKSFRFELEGAPPDTFVSKYESARYYTNVFRRTQKEGSALLSCPLCLIGHSIWGTKGWRFGNIFEVRISSRGDVLSRAKIYPSTERFTEEDALRFSRMKVQRPS